MHKSSHYTVCMESTVVRLDNYGQGMRPSILMHDQDPMKACVERYSTRLVVCMYSAPLASIDGESIFRVSRGKPSRTSNGGGNTYRDPVSISGILVFYRGRPRPNSRKTRNPTVWALGIAGLICKPSTAVDNMQQRVKRGHARKREINLKQIVKKRFIRKSKQTFDWQRKRKNNFNFSEF